jgi:ribonuclease-3
VCSAEAGSLPPHDPTDRDLNAIQERLGYRFREPSLLETALTHRSAAHEDGAHDLGNERLEFLGDAVLDLLVSELLMESDRDADEGLLSRARAEAVNTQALAKRALELGLDREVRLGRGEARSGGGSKPSILANVFEAVVAAVYRDGGLDAARSLVGRTFASVTTLEIAPEADAKTRLQELLQSQGRELPRYETLTQRGPDHASEWEVQVFVEGQPLGSGVGRSKRDAEQAAAKVALEQLSR